MKIKDELNRLSLPELDLATRHAICGGQLNAMEKFGILAGVLLPITLGLLWHFEKPGFLFKREVRIKASVTPTLSREEFTDKGVYMQDPGLDRSIERKDKRSVDNTLNAEWIDEPKPLINTCSTARREPFRIFSHDDGTEKMENGHIVIKRWRTQGLGIPLGHQFLDGSSLEYTRTYVTSQKDIGNINKYHHVYTHTLSGQEITYTGIYKESWVPEKSFEDMMKHLTPVDEKTIHEMTEQEYQEHYVKPFF